MGFLQKTGSAAGFDRVHPGSAAASAKAGKRPRRWCTGRLSTSLLGGLAVATFASGVAGLQDFDQTSCDEFLIPPREVRGRSVGPTSCLMQETDLTFEGRTFRRLDMGLDGTVDGFLTPTIRTLTNAPDLVFAQAAAPGPVVSGVAAYERDKGASMTVIYPLQRRDWNDNMWVTAHGEGQSFREGQLLAWNRNLDRRDPIRDLNKYDRLILSKGYVLVKTRRTTSGSAPGEILTTLEDGSTVNDAALTDSAQYVVDFTRTAERAIASRLGAPPRRTYFYGHSAGASLGRGMNYTPRLNLAPDGAPVFDGILADDAAGGGWLPRLVKDSTDVLLAAESDRASFVPQVDLTHQMYNAVWPLSKADYVSISPLANARRNAAILLDKRLGSKTRTYEVRSVSHDAGQELHDDPLTRALDLSTLIDRLIDHLDAWVERGIAPPATRSDWTALGDSDGDGNLENAAIALPEVACPLGVYFPYPASSSAGSSFAAFTAGELEPLDEDGVFVDMNRNGIRDRRDTPAQAWRRLGLLRQGAEFTREKYVACVEAAAGRLQDAGFFSNSTARNYVERARAADLPRDSQRP